MVRKRRDADLEKLWLHYKATKDVEARKALAIEHRRRENETRKLGISSQRQPCSTCP